jgi:hypothetical protein
MTTMSDDLRTRIAAALQGAADDGYSLEDWLFLADAVIAELGLNTVVECARDWYKNYDITPANDPRNPTDVDIAYDDAGYQILVALGLEKPMFP